VRASLSSTLTCWHEKRNKHNRSTRSAGHSLVQYKKTSDQAIIRYWRAVNTGLYADVLLLLLCFCRSFCRPINCSTEGRSYLGCWWHSSDEPHQWQNLNASNARASVSGEYRPSLYGFQNWLTCCPRVPIFAPTEACYSEQPTPWDQSNTFTRSGLSHCYQYASTGLTPRTYILCSRLTNSIILNHCLFLDTTAPTATRSKQYHPSLANQHRSQLHHQTATYSICIQSKLLAIQTMLSNHGRHLPT
jgi:hypothetical protein